MNKKEEEKADPFAIQKYTYEQIAKYGWEQEGDTVKIYITSDFDGIGKHKKEDIDCEFNDDSVDLRVLGFKGKNFRLKI